MCCLKYSLPALLSCMFLGTCFAEKRGTNGFEIQHGINISHWLSQVYAEEKDRIRYFNELDVIFLKNAGFDHIRLPVDEERLWEENGKRIEKSFAELHHAVEWCQRHGLRVIVDLHIVRSHYFNAEFEGIKNTLFTDTAAMEHFLDLWKTLSAELKEYPNSLVAYEILNEASAKDPEDWNRLVNKAVALIRSLEPERTIVVGSNNWQGPETFKFLDVPENDPNVILSFHLYSPMPVTHYRASWSELYPYDGAIRYPGVPVDEEVFQQNYPSNTLKKLREQNKYSDADTQAKRIQLALDVADAHGLRLYCGEFGCLPTVPREIRLKWYSDIVQVMEKMGVACAAWDYKGQFYLVDYDSDKIDWELARILTGKESL